MLNMLDPDEEDILMELEKELGYSPATPKQDAAQRAGQEKVDSSEARSRLAGLAGGMFSPTSAASPAAASSPAMNTGWNEVAEPPPTAASLEPSKPPPDKKGQGGFFGRMFGGSKAAMVPSPEKVASTNKPASPDAVAPRDQARRSTF